MPNIVICPTTAHGESACAPDLLFAWDQIAGVLAKLGDIRAVVSALVGQTDGHLRSHEVREAALLGAGAYRPGESRNPGDA